jgi:hypothetical protein
MPRAKTSARPKAKNVTTSHKKRNTTSKNTRATRTTTAKRGSHPQIIKHHAKRLWHATPMFVHGMVTGAFVGLVLVFSLGKVNSANALTLTASRDCDDYAIIHCGALSTSELKKDYNLPGVAPIYKHFGISATNISNIGSLAVAGRVYDDGKVKVNGEVVATKAITAARKYVKGSHTVTINGVTYYVRYVSASLSRSSEAAFVVMKNGVFDYAIMGPCGNPVMATAKQPATTPTPSTTPTPTTPTPTTPTTNTPPTEQTPTTETEKAKIVTASKITTLPNTGPGALIIVLTLSILGGYVFHRTHHHVKHRRHYHYLG